MKYLSPLILGLAILFSNSSLAQAPTVQDCGGAIPICQNVYSNSVSYSGDGNYADVSPTSGSCVASEYNTVWYIFTAQTTGNFSFTIQPVNNADDYDWAVYDLSNNTCADIASGVLLPVSCNSYGSLSGYNGPTGVSTAQGGTDNSNGPGDLNGPPWNSDMPVVAGSTYVMMVDNWTSSVYGYSINFSASTATIFDNIPPVLDSITSPITCNTTSLTVKFSEKLLTSTVSTGDFTLTGPGGPYILNTITPATGAMGVNQEMSFNISFAPPIQFNGVYTLNLVGPVTDLCGNVATLGGLSFTVTQIPGPPATSNNSPVCQGDTLFLGATSLPGASFHWTGPAGFVSNVQNPVLTGFSATQAGVYLVTSSLNGCTSEPAVVNVAIQPSTLNINLGNDTVLCSDATLLLNAGNNNGQGDVTFLWHNSYSNTTSTASTFLANKPGNYWVVGSDLCGSDGDTITVAYNDMELDLGLDQGNICNTASVVLDASAPLAGYPSVTYHWSTGATTASITAIAAGDYSVTVSRGLCIERDTVTLAFVSPLQVNLGPDVLLCPGSTTTLTPGIFPFAIYTWSTGAASSSLVVSNPGNYTVSVTNGCGTFTDSKVVGVQSPPLVNLGPDTALCAGSSLSFSALNPNCTYFWSTGQSQPGISVNAPGVYAVTVTSECGSTSDQVMVGLQTPLQINLGPDTTVCPGFVLNSGISSGQVFWSNGMTTASIAVNGSDLYLVEATNLCGTYTDQVQITVLSIQLDLGPDQYLCPGQGVTLAATNYQAGYLWSNGASTPEIFASATGLYSVTVTNDCGVAIDGVSIFVFDPVLYLGPDTSVCPGETVWLDASHAGSMYVWSTGENTQSITTNDPGLVWVTLSHACGQLSDSLLISWYALPEPDLGPDTLFINPGQTISLNPGNTFTTYAWSNGQTTPTLTVTTPGTFQVTVTNEDGCIAFDSVTILQKDGMAVQDAAAIQVVANGNVLLISSPRPMRKITFVSILGQTVEYQVFGAMDFQESVPFSGWFFVKIELDGKQTVVKPVYSDRSN